jgi:hypothetical protein
LGLRAMMLKCTTEYGLWDADTSFEHVEGSFKTSPEVVMWVKNAIASVPFSASTMEALIQVLHKEFNKVVGAGDLERWRSGLLAPLKHKPGKPLMLRSFYNGKETVSRLQSMLPMVAHYLLHLEDDDLCKLNLLFEDLQVDLMEGRKADPRFKLPSARTMSDLVTEHGQVCLVKGVRRGT